MSYYDEKVARALLDIANEMRCIGKTLRGMQSELRKIRYAAQSVDRRQQTTEEKENIAALREYLSQRNAGDGEQDVKEQRRGVCGAAELDGTPCVGCRPQPCMYELRGGLENG